MSDIFVDLDAVLYAESYEWLADNAPLVALEVERLVALNATPEQIRSRVLQKLGQHRIEFATRCENAAKHVLNRAIHGR